MSGDVQPRKRKDKKRKKDDLGVNEPRGTSAALGDGDSFMHSHHDHGTGGHWCAKVIFFSLLAILVALIGLIILENRGLSELEANAVQSQYSGVLEGWLEDAPEDDHHDTHTLELNHHDDEDDAEHGEELEHSDEIESDDHDDDEEAHDDDDEHDVEGDDNGSPEDDENSQADEDEAQDDDDDDEEAQNDEETQDDEDGSQEQDLEASDEDEELPNRKYYHGNEAEPDDNDDDDDEGDHENAKDDDEEENEQLSNDVDQENDYDDDNDDDDDDGDDDNNDKTDNQSLENSNQENEDDYDENDINENIAPNTEADSEENNNEDGEEHNEEEEEDTSLEVEKIEQEASEEEEPISVELPALPEPDDNDDDDKTQESVEDEAPEADDDDNEVNEQDDDFPEADDDEPPVERITAPAGKPFAEEEEEETSSEKPADTLAEEEEYEKRQEELRKEEEQASHMWLKLSVGGALLVATHAIVRRATASSDAPTEQRVAREETPVDRRMTLIPEEPTESVPIKKVTQPSTRPVIQEVTKQLPSIVKSSPTFEDSEEEVEEEEEEQETPVVSKVAYAAQSAKQDLKQELYSDEEEAEDEEVEEEEKVVEKKAVPQVAKPPTPEPDDDVPDDVEIIEDEQIEEEAEEDEEDEEEISDVDDEELLTRLEAKYGRLPEPERPQRRKDGGNSIEDEWPGEPSDAYWRQQLDQAEQELDQGAWLAAAERAGARPLRGSARARRLEALALDAAAEHRRDNALLGRAINAYLELLKMNERLSDKKLLEVTERTINRIQFRGTYLNAEPVYRLLMRRFPDDPSHRTNLTVMFLMANRADLAENVLKETLQRWPEDRLALAQYGFILKTQHNRLEEAVDFLQRALEGDTGPATEPRYYYHLGDTLLSLGRFEEAHEVHKRGAAHGHFLSPAQRSLYNVPRLKGRPWWNIEDTPYAKLARALEKSWRTILREGEAAKALYEQEKEGLKERGEWSQLDLFARGREIAGRCARAPVTCGVVRAEAAAAGCRRGQVKFSAMQAGTRVRPHVGPTNCRLRMHLGLSNTKDTFIRVDQETRQWEEGKVFVFDDSFEHEVWHNGTGSRLVLIVDVWHPELTPAERRQLPAI